MLVLASTACRTPFGPDTGADSLTAGESAGGQANPNVLIVTLGGWGSCQLQILQPTPVGMFLHDQTVQLAKNLTAGVPDAKVATMMTCLGLNQPLPGTPFWYWSSTAPQRVSRADVGHLVDVVVKEWEAQARPRLVVIGHSYGGYLGQQLTAEFARQTGIRIFRLYTVEPISGQTCKVLDVATAEPGKLPTGCLKAPGEPLADGSKDPRDQMDNTQVAAGAEAWVNFHLDPAYFDASMHSDRIAAAVNQAVEPPKPLGSPTSPHENSHHRVGFMPAVWTAAPQPTAKAICADLAAGLGFDAQACQPIKVHLNTGRRLE